ncbi:hypothetical protein Moror_11996 [Moniliophthora roreri MCA 2997]|uniref:Uncharacterized protein n=1 Tax=Moniliophthora roreri (strain MCA 2997) TaxID=1381753 RepID=V2WJI4_MONRO|nr:hypothetical protein Moror_11996 [Moniliophthora roreri MCA 2997]KAI3599054.1 hypothetical protein WG66_004068 [Moniliophthora roreri]
MAFFQGPSNFTIPNGNFTIVQGSQHINHFGGVAVQQAAEKEPTLWDEYKRLRACDVHLTRLVDGTGNARRDAEACQGVVARRTISIARISSEKDKEFLHVQYRGRYAYEEFEWDFKQFSGIKHPYIAQLFGYNDNRHGFPALIFYDALIPLERIIYTRGRLSLILYAYFSFQLAMQQTLTDGHDHVSMNELWVEPRSGALIRGPPIEIPSHVIRHIIPIRPDSASSRYLHPLCIQTYNNTQIVLQHLTEMLSARTVLRGIGRGGGVIVPVLTDEAAISLLRSPCAIYNLYDRRRVIARCARPKRQAYRLFEVFGFPDAIKETRTVMADGSVRFAITLPDNQYPRILIRLVYTVDLEEDRDTVEYAWLTQAHSVFRQLGICPDEWEDYYQRDLATLHGPPHQYIYSFVRFHNLPMIMKPGYPGKMAGKYYWSSSDTGMENQEISEAKLVSLRLPSFMSEIGALYHQWNRVVYKTVQEIHSILGFDPATTDLTRSLGFPIFDVIRDKDQFEDCGKDSMTTTSDSYNDTGEVEPSMSDSEDIDSDEEIVLYPRQ